MVTCSVLVTWSGAGYVLVFSLKIIWKRQMIQRHIAKVTE